MLQPRVAGGLLIRRLFWWRGEAEESLAKPLNNITAHPRGAVRVRRGCCQRPKLRHLLWLTVGMKEDHPSELPPLLRRIHVEGFTLCDDFAKRFVALRDLSCVPQP